MDTYTTLPATEAYVAVRGKIDQITDLLRDLYGIGKRRCSGYGAVKLQTGNCEPDIDVWPVEPEDADTFAIIGRDGLPLRPVPVDLWKAIGGSSSARTATVATQGLRWIEPRCHAVIPHHIIPEPRVFFKAVGGRRV